MKKKLLIAAFFTFSGASAMAQSSFEGGYIQFGIGAETISPNFKGGIYEYGNINGASYSATGNNSHSFAGTIGAGYIVVVTPSFLLGIGAEYSPFANSKADVSVIVPSQFSLTRQYYKKNSYNIFISPSIAIGNNKLLYAKLGYTGATMAQGHTFIDINGYSLGLGYKQVISGGLYGFGEVNYASYANPDRKGNLTGSFSVKATNLLVGLGYKF